MKTQTLQPTPHRAIAPVHALVVCGALALIAGCASEPESHVVSAPPPPAPTATVAVATTPAPTTTAVAVPVAGAAPGTVVITQAPPAPQPEAVTARPSSDHVWIPGYWTWRNNRYEWMAGHWDLPPRSGSKWVAPRWQPENGAYRFYEGYWD
jgi:hypothetical protein